jgi:rare lipoprotein A (peptidoglycan hydrolase)
MDEIAACVLGPGSGYLNSSETTARERKEIGLASYYSQGQRTASGEPFVRNELTGAHRTLPFGTRVRVTMFKTGKHVIVRINDGAEA